MRGRDGIEGRATGSVVDMPSRRPSHDRQLGVLLAAMLSRSRHDMNGRPVAEDVTEMVETAGDRTDLLAEAVGLHTWGWAQAEDVRQRELAALLGALGLPDVDRWHALARDRAAVGGHPAEEPVPQAVGLPGMGLFGRAEPPEL